MNNVGQLGNGNTSDSNIPVQVPSLSQVIAVSLGDSHSLALKDDGTVWAWGSHLSGELGVGSATVGWSTVPLKIPSLSNIVAISAGHWFSMALKNDGSVWTWGYNFNGNLGNGTTTSTNTPIQVLSINNITAISAGYMHCLALQSDSTVWSWGGNSSGQLGDGTNIDSYTPIKINNFGSVYAIDAGDFHSVALKQLASVWHWGSSNFSNVPVEMSTISNPFYGSIKIAAGGGHSFAIKYNGRLRAWGDGTSGQLGDGANGISPSPVQVVSFTTNASAVAAGGQHSLILKDDGTLWATGSNFYGQLGTGNNTDSNVPVMISGLCSIMAGVKDQVTPHFKIEIYPNPNSGSFNIQLPSYFDSGQLIIYNMLGEVIKSQEVTSVNNKIVTDGITSGIYSCLIIVRNNVIYQTKISVVK